MSSTLRIIFVCAVIGVATTGFAAQSVFTSGDTLVILADATCFVGRELFDPAVNPVARFRLEQRALKLAARYCERKPEVLNMKVHRNEVYLFGRELLVAGEVVETKPRVKENTRGIFTLVMYRMLTSQLQARIRTARSDPDRREHATGVQAYRSTVEHRLDAARFVTTTKETVRSLVGQLAALSRVDSARVLLKGNPAQAAALCSRALQDAPDFGYAHRLGSRAHRALGDGERARRWLYNATVYDSTNAPLWLEYAGVLLEQNDTTAAIDALSRTIALDPSHNEPFERRALLFVARDKIDRAAADYTILIDRQPHNGELRHQRGHLLVALGQFDAARKDLEMVVATGGFTVRDVKVLTDLHVRAGQVSEAVAACTRGVEKYPDVADLWYRRGRLRMDAGEHRAAAADLSAAIDRGGSRPDLFYRRARLFLLDGRMQEAQTLFSRALLAGTCDSCLLYRAHALEQTGNLEAALRDVNEHIEQNGANGAALFLRGILHERKKRFTEAVADFSGALAFDSTRTECFRRRAHAFAALGSPEAAAVDMRRYSAQHSGCDSCHYFTAQRYAELHNLPEALFFINKAVAMDEENPAYRQLRARIYLDGGDTTAAVEDVERIVSTPEPPPAFLFLGAQLAVANGRSSRARELVVRLLARDPRHGRAWQLAGDLMMERNQHDSALVAYTRAVAVEPLLAESHSARGAILFSRKNMDTALPALNQAILLDSTRVNPFWLRAQIHIERNNQAAALKDLSRTLQLNPHLAPAWFERGKILFDRGDAASAENDFLQATAISPNMAKAHLYLARIGLHNARYDDAAAAADRVIAIDTTWLTAFRIRGIAYRHLGTNDTQARRDLDRVCAQRPDDGRVLYERGVIRMRTGDEPGAYVDFTRAIERAPELVDARVRRGILLLRQKKYSPAIKDFTTALKHEPDNVTALTNRGFCHGSLRDHVAAIADFTRAIELAPHTARTWFNRGMMYMALKQSKAARADFEQFLTLHEGEGPLVNQAKKHLETVKMDFSLE